LPALFGLQTDPFDVVLFRHGVFDAADGYRDDVTIPDDDGDVFLLGSLDGIWYYFLHGFPTADDFYAAWPDIGDDVTAMPANEKFKIHDFEELVFSNIIIIF
jgi:hypothetical protein